MWWNLSTVRFINYNQDDIAFRARRWGQLFDGSSVDVYQWIESSVTPANYTGIGTVFSTTSYTTTTQLDSAGTFVTTYYYWVKGLTAVSPNKTLKFKWYYTVYCKSKKQWHKLLCRNCS